MNYIRDFAVVRLKKNAVIEFFELLMTYVEACTSLKTNLADQYELLKAAVEEVLRWGELTLKSNLTAKIHDLDSQRDSWLIALEHALDAQAISLDPEVRDKAIAVQNKYRSIDVPRQAQYFQESGALDMLLNALLGELLEETTAIGVLPIVNALKAANDEMHRLLIDRSNEMAQKPEMAFENARRTAEAVYREFVFNVNAYIAMYVVRANQPDESLATFVLDLNEFLRKYSITQFKTASKGEVASTPPQDENSGEENTEGENNGGENNTQTPPTEEDLDTDDDYGFDEDLK